MRIIDLEFYAFGPYPGLQRIDFVPINERQLFLITGPTGSGKTTIFDAISFALFSEPSGSYRDKMGIRSHLCQTSEKTYVKLTFEINNKRYQITRYPQQERINKKGGTTVDNSEAYLKMPDGTMIEGVKRVNEELTNILKLSSSQFKRIVMLAQGEFRELLFASSKEREEIFRVIFGTEDIKRFAEILQTESKILDENQKGIRQEIDITCNNLNLTIPMPHRPFDLIALAYDEDPLFEHIEKELNEDEKERTTINNAKDKIFKELDVIKSERQKAEDINNLLDDLIAKEKQLAKLKADEPTIKEKQMLVEMIKNLPLVETYEQAYLAQKAEVEALNESCSQKNEEINTNQDQLNRNRDNLTQNQIDFEKVRCEWNNQNYQNYQENLSIFFEYDELIKQFEVQQKQFTQVNNDYDQAIKKLTEQENLKENKEREKASLEEELLQKPIIYEQKVNQEKIVEKYEAINKKHINLRAYQEQERLLNQNLETEESKYRTLSSALTNLKIEYNRFQAGVLADTLRPGEPCPVCGSTEHPMKASHSAEVSKELIEEKEQQCKKQEEKCNGLLAQIKANSLTQAKWMEEINEDASELGLVFEDLDNFEELIKAQKEKRDTLNNTYQALVNQDQKLTKLKTEIKNIDEKIKEFTKEKERLQSEKTSLKTRLEGTESRIKQIEKLLPEFYENAQKLKIFLEEKQSIIQRLDKSIQDLTTTIAKLDSSIKEKTKNLYEDKKKLAIKEQDLQKAKEVFNQAIREKFENLDNYKRCQEQKSNEYLIKQTIDEYNREVNKLSNLIEDLRKRTEGKVRLDLQSFNDQIESHNQRLAELDALDEEISIKISNNRQSLSKLRILYQKFKEAYVKYQTVAHLDKMTRGMNDYHLSFERYILSSYFESILSSANFKLMEMTGGRYQFEKKEVNTAGNTQQGLDINIFDNYSGKERDVKTLSGGELFKASLALALGLSDVIQQNVGGIAINTLFIDEGFGSLDSESLDMALQTLTDIQAKGKIIGIISHVQEVKDRFSTKIMIGTSKDGSFIEKITI